MADTKVYSVRLPIEQIERLKNAKWDFRKSVNAIVKDAIDSYLESEYKKLKKKGKK